MIQSLINNYLLEEQSHNKIYGSAWNGVCPMISRGILK